MYGIFTNIYPKNHPIVGKYTSTMEHMGFIGVIWLVVLTILKNMKVNRKDYPIYYGK